MASSSQTATAQPSTTATVGVTTTAAGTAASSTASPGKTAADPAASSASSPATADGGSATREAARQTGAEAALLSLFGVSNATGSSSAVSALFGTAETSETSTSAAKNVLVAGLNGGSSGSADAGSSTAVQLISQLFAAQTGLLAGAMSNSGSGWSAKSQVQDAYDWYADTDSKAA